MSNRAHPSIVSPALRPLCATSFATSAHLFCARLRYSGKPFVMAFPHEQQEAFFEANRHTLDYWGATQGLVYYNTACLELCPRNSSSLGTSTAICV